MATVIKGDNAKLINEGSKLAETVKLMNGRLTEIKAILKDELDPGTYITKKNKTMCISSFDKYTDVTPDDAMTALKKMRLGKRFNEVIKVQITPLKKLIGEVRLDGIRTVIEKTVRISFK